MTAYATAMYVKVEGGIVSGRGIKSLCEKLTQKGYNVPGAQFNVLDFYDDEVVTQIKCNPEGHWMKLVPVHWQVVYKPKNNPIPRITVQE